MAGATRDSTFSGTHQVGSVPADSLWTGDEAALRNRADAAAIADAAPWRPPARGPPGARTVP